MSSPSIVWLRDDLRVADNPALQAAIAREAPVIVLYVLDEHSAGIRALGGAARWWLHYSLMSLDEELRERGAQLVLRSGPAGPIVREITREVHAGAVFWNRRYGGAERAVDTALKAQLRADGVDVSSFAGSVLHEPWTVTTGSGTPYSVFTPFWRACRSLPAPRLPFAAPESIDGVSTGPRSDRLDEWELLPARPDWAAGLRETWTPGEAAAEQRLREFLDDDLAGYDRDRDVPSVDATSLLSPRLRWGELSPFTVYHAATKAKNPGGFLSELGWREFAWHVLFHFPLLATKNLKSAFDQFPWPAPNAEHLRAWKRGETGFPLVDAGMQELWQTGFMHNRVRMVTASFLVKNLLVDWRIGEEWLWDTLVDADSANNPFNWQWVAGSGADAAPYFRVFNPELQAKKFDPQGEYIARWAPVALTAPIVDLAASRRAALMAYESVRGNKTQ